VDLATVNRDIHFLRQQAQENIQKHIHETVPEEYERCMVGMKRNLRQTLEIAETASDPRTKLQARAIVNDCYKYIMDLTTNGVIVHDALRFIQSKVDKLNDVHKLDEKIEAGAGAIDKEILEEEATTNGVF
jgi:hypothetical protein